MKEVFKNRGGGTGPSDLLRNPPDPHQTPPCNPPWTCTSQSLLGRLFFLFIFRQVDPLRNPPDLSRGAPAVFTNVGKHPRRERGGPGREGGQRNG